MKRILILILAPLAFAVGLSAQSLLTPAADTSIEATQARAAQRIGQLTAAGYDQLVRLQREGIDLVWRNADGLTPQQVCDALGTSAAKVFAIHSALTQALVSAQQADGIPVSVALPTHEYVINPDGTVSVAADPLAP